MIVVKLPDLSQITRITELANQQRAAMERAMFVSTLPFMNQISRITEVYEQQQAAIHTAISEIARTTSLVSSVNYILPAIEAVNAVRLPDVSRIVAASLAVHASHHDMISNVLCTVMPLITQAKRQQDAILSSLWIANPWDGLQKNFMASIMPLLELDSFQGILSHRLAFLADFPDIQTRLWELDAEELADLSEEELTVIAQESGIGELAPTDSLADFMLFIRTKLESMESKQDEQEAKQNEQERQSVKRIAKWLLVFLAGLIAKDVVTAVWEHYAIHKRILNVIELILPKGEEKEALHIVDPTKTQLAQLRIVKRRTDARKRNKAKSGRVAILQPRSVVRLLNKPKRWSYVQIGTDLTGECAWVRTKYLERIG
jgi:hypothetical protein